MSPSSNYRRRLKEAASQVKKLRGWAGSDASVGEALVDALNELTALRLLGHAYAESAADAQDALTRANALVAEHGAVGPFTPVDDAVRFVTATAALARVQAGLGQPGAGAATAAAAQAWAGLLPHVDLAPYLTARTASWLLQVRARGALAARDLGPANAFADAAVLRVREGELSGVDAPARVDALLVAAATRTAAGLLQDAAAFAAEAQAVAQASLDDADGSSSSARPHTDGRLGALAAAGGARADAELAQGRWQQAASTRQGLVSALGHRAVSVRERAVTEQTRADLARDLAGGGDADAALTAAEASAQGVGRLTALGGEEILPAQFAAATVLAEALLRAGRTNDAADALVAVLGRDSSLRHPPSARAWRVVALLRLAEAQRAAGEEAAATTQDRAMELLGRVLAEDPYAAVSADASPAVRALAAARGVLPPGPGPAPSWHALDDASAWSASTRGGLSVADAVAPVPQAPQEVPDPQVTTAPVGDVATTVPAAEDREPSRSMAEDLGASAPDEAASPDLVTAWQTARASLEAAVTQGDRRTVLEASQAVVDALRPLVVTDAARWTPDLVTALEALGEATFRAGDWWGSRAPRREAKALSKGLPR